MGTMKAAWKMFWLLMPWTKSKIEDIKSTLTKVDEAVDLIAAQECVMVEAYDRALEDVVRKRNEANKALDAVKLLKDQIVATLK